MKRLEDEEGGRVYLRLTHADRRALGELMRSFEATAGERDRNGNPAGIPGADGILRLGLHELHLSVFGLGR